MQSETKTNIRKHTRKIKLEKKIGINKCRKNKKRMKAKLVRIQLIAYQRLRQAVS